MFKVIVRVMGHEDHDRLIMITIDYEQLYHTYLKT